MRVVILLTVLLQTSLAYKILVFNVKFGHSHVNYLSALADILAEVGHDVTTLISDIDPALSNVTKLSRIVYVPPDTEASAGLHKKIEGDSDLFVVNKRGLANAIQVGNIVGEIFGKQCRKLLRTPDLVQTLEDDRYDVFITENFDYCGIGVSHLISAKAVITVSTTALFDLTALHLGLPLAQSYNPTFPSFDVHSMCHRLRNLYERLCDMVLLTLFKSYAQREFVEFNGSSFPDLGVITAKSAFHFTNSEPLIDFARPKLHKIVELGGLGVRDVKPLNEYWNGVLSMRKKTVLLSFGSVIRSAFLLPKYRQSILKAFAQLPDVTFIWKYENLEDDFALNDAAKVSNVVLARWVPQNDLLGDERLAGFITHAGMGSTQETAARGVPALLIPLYGDQPRNAAILESIGMGTIFDKSQMANYKAFALALKKFLEDDRLKVNAARVSQLLANRPYSPKDKLLKYVNFAAEFGPVENLTPQGIRLNFAQYYFLDAIVLFIVIVSVTVYVIVRLTLFVLRKLRQSGKAKDS